MNSYSNRLLFLFIYLMYGVIGNLDFSKYFKTTYNIFWKFGFIIYIDFCLRKVLKCAEIIVITDGK